MLRGYSSNNVGSGSEVSQAAGQVEPRWLLEKNDTDSGIAMMSKFVTEPYFYIIYVRGYADSEGKIEDMVADPYTIFSIVATKL